MGRKVFISFLGTGNYIPCHYYEETKKEEHQSKLVKYVQEAIIELYCKDFGSNDNCYFFLTGEARKMNWENDGQYNPVSKNYDLPNHGLLEKLNGIKKRQNNSLNFETKDIPEGFSTKQIWEIFNSLLSCISNENEIILDITHAFRSIPMLGIVMINFLKVTRSIKVRGIFYGAFEKLGRPDEVLAMKEEERYAPIIDLITFSELQDWTLASDSFVRYGKTDRIIELSKDPFREFAGIFKGEKEDFNALRGIASSLERFTSFIETNRGLELMDFKFSCVFNNLRILSESRENYLAPFYANLENIKNKLLDFGDNDDFLFIRLAEWCRKHSLLQQGITQLKEGITTYFAKKYHKDITNHDVRNEIDRALYSLAETNHAPQAFFINPLLDDPEAKELASGFKNFVTAIRNDINHNGIRRDASRPANLKKQFDDFLEKTIAVFHQNKNLEAEFRPSLILLNLSNHPSSTWPENQKKAAQQQYSSVEDLPFPQINPTWSSDQIFQLAEDYENKIRKINPTTVHIMGEMTFCLALITRLKAIGIPCIASTTERQVVEKAGIKTSVFTFVQFRSY